MFGNLKRYKFPEENRVKSYPDAVFGLILVAIILFGMTLASIAGLTRTLDIDEAFTANVVHLSTPSMLEEFRQDSAVPLHYMLLKAWTRSFGESEFSLRSMSLLFFGLTILTVGLTGRWVMGQQCGLIAALFLSMSNRGLWWAMAARPYALLILQISLVIPVYFYLIRLLPTHPQHHSTTSLTQRDVFFCLLLIVLNVSGLLNQPIYIFFMCAYTLAALWVSKRAFWRLLGCCTVSFLIYLALWGGIWREQLTHPSVAWMGHPDLLDLGQTFFLGWGWNSLLILLYLVVLVLFPFQTGIEALTDRPSLVSISIIAFAIFLPFVIAQFKPFFLSDRISTVFVPISCLLITTLISRLGGRHRVLTIVVLALLPVAPIIKATQDFNNPEPSITPAIVQNVVDRAKCGDTVVYTDFSFSPAEYYMRRLGAPDCIRKETFPAESQFHPGWQFYPSKEDYIVEATSTAARFADQSESTIWVFYREHPLADILKLEMDRQLALLYILRDERSPYAIMVYSTGH
jgi:hypothetical protein